MSCWIPAPFFCVVLNGLGYLGWCGPDRQLVAFICHRWVGLAVAGSLALAGIEVLGARAVCGFISVDSLVSPVGLVAPWGASPMSAAEFREYRADVRATVAGMGVGVVSPRITPLRQSVMGTTTPDATIVRKGITSVSGFGIDRLANFGVGMGNYAITPQEKDLSWKDALKEGFKSAVGGAVGDASTRRADGVRGATPRVSGE